MNSEPDHPSVSAVRRRMRVRGDRPASPLGGPASSARRRRGRRVSEAVVAGYIHELSSPLRRRGEHRAASAS